MFDWLKKLFRGHITKKKTLKEEILEQYQTVSMPTATAEKPDISSLQYRIFKEEETWKTLPRTTYEKLCNKAEKILRIEPDEKSRAKLQKSIDFCHLNITPEGVVSLSILIVLFSTMITFFFILLGMFTPLPGISPGNAILVFLIVLPFAYYMYLYPVHLERRFRIKAGSEIVMLVLYMSIYMRNSPNMESALSFAAKNLSGPLSYDIRKLLWDIEVGKYNSIDEALTDYLEKWKDDKDFVEAMQILSTSLTQTENRRINMLDEAINVILDGTREKAREYNLSLKMPVMMIHALGVLLPIMGMVMFPVVAIFLSDVIKPMALFVGYDIVLPLLLFFFITNTLEMRPVTFSNINISSNPNLPPKGKFALSTKDGVLFVPAWIPALVLGTVLCFMGIVGFTTSGGELGPSVVLISGVAVALGIYYYLISFQAIKIRNEIKQMEKEFSEALFQLANRTASGLPTEVAVERSAKSIGSLQIQKMFKIVVNNMKKMGMTFEQAFFDKNHGALRYFHSDLIRSIIKVVVDSSKKGVQIAGLSMLAISRYLRGIYRTDREVSTELNDVVSSLKFQIFFLTPFICGIVVTMATIIINILATLGEQIQNIQTGGFGTVLDMWGNVPITPGAFQLIVGIYFIETAVLLSMFINGIENGEDDISRHNLIGKSLLVGLLIYIIALFGTLSIFGPLTYMIIS